MELSFMEPSSSILTWECQPNARLRDDGLWYPSVVFRFMGFRMQEIQYDFPLDDEATAMTFARTFARDEMAILRRSIALSMKTIFPPP